MSFERKKVKEQITQLSQSGVMLGTSSWEYAGWSGLHYDSSRYEYQNKFAKVRFEINLLSKYAEVF